MADKLVYIPNDNTKISPLGRLQAQLNERTNQNSIKVLKVVKPTNKSVILKLWGLV